MRNEPRARARYAEGRARCCALSIIKMKKMDLTTLIGLVIT